MGRDFVDSVKASGGAERSTRSITSFHQIVAMRVRELKMAVTGLVFAL